MTMARKEANFDLYKLLIFHLVLWLKRQLKILMSGYIRFIITMMKSHLNKIL